MYFWFDPAHARRGLGTYGALVDLKKAEILASKAVDPAAVAAAKTRLDSARQAVEEKAIGRNRGNGPTGAGYLARKRDLLDVTRVQFTAARAEADRLYRAMSRDATVISTWPAMTPVVEPSSSGHENVAYSRNNRRS